MLHVTAFFGAETDFGGISGASEGLCEALANEGIATTVLTTDLQSRFARKQIRSRNGSEESRGVRIVRLPVFSTTLGGYTGLYVPLRFGATFRQLIKQADLVHFHGFRSYLNMAATRPTLRAGVKYSIQPHGTMTGGFGKELFKRLYDSFVGNDLRQRCQLFFASSSVEKEQLLRLGIEDQRVNLAHIGINRSRWAQAVPDRNAFLERIGLSWEVPVVLYVGRLDHTKGLDVLVRAFQLLMKEIPAARLVLVGPDFGIKPSLEAEALGLSISDSVIFAGQCTQDDVQRAYKTATVTVVPSTYESYSLVALEAAAAGSPVVLSAACGVSPLFLNTRVPIVPPTPTELSSAISDLLGNEGLRAACVASYKNIPWDDITWTAVAKGVVDAYDKLLYA